jgi:glutamine synthetase
MKKIFSNTFFIRALFIAASIVIPVNAKIERPTTRTKAMAQSKDLSIKYVDFSFMDVAGHLKEITLPIERVEGALEKGIFFDGSSVAGYTIINDSDLLLKADLAGTFLSPWRGNGWQTAHIFCDIHKSATEPYPHCPRYVLKRALERAKNAGFKAYCGIELEFHLLKKNLDGTLAPTDDNIYCDAITNIEMKNFKNSLLYALDFAGIEVEKTHHEVSCGQHEIVLRYGDPLLVADSLIMAKHIMQTAAEQNGYVITFMPKPIAKVNGNGMHMHFSLWDEATNKNLFYDAKKPSFLSDIAKHFIAGNLKHLQDMTLLLNSSVNSFKRLVPGYEAPVYLSWGYKNRSTAIRIPETDALEVTETDGAPMRMEFRSPDPTCNPYYAFAAIIHAGLDGIETKATPSVSIERNLYHATQEELTTLKIKTIPHSLGESLSIYKKSAFMKKVLGDSLHKRLGEIQEKNWEEYSLTEKNDPLIVTDWERKKHRLIS